VRQSTSGLSRLIMWLVVGLVVIETTSPAVVAVLHAALPIAIVVGVVAIALRAVWYFTSRY